MAGESARDRIDTVALCLDAGAVSDGSPPVQHSMYHIEIVLTLSRPSIWLCDLARTDGELAAQCGRAVELHENACEVARVVRLEVRESVFAEVRLDRAGARHRRRYSHHHEVEHLVAMREVAKRIPLHCHDADIGSRKCSDQVVIGDEAVADRNRPLETELFDQLDELAPVASVAVDLHAQTWDLSSDHGGREHERVEPVMPLDRAMADDAKRAVVAASSREALTVEDRLVRRVQDHSHASDVRSALRERLALILRARQGRIGEADAALFNRGDDSDNGMTLRHLELRGEELGHALVKVEDDLRSGQLGDQRGEDQRIRNGIHLNEVIAAEELQQTDDGNRHGEKRSVERDIHEGRAAPVMKRKPEDPEPPVTLPAWSAWLHRANHIDLMAGVEECVDFPTDAYVVREPELTNNADPRHCEHTVRDDKPPARGELRTSGRPYDAGTTSKTVQTIAGRNRIKAVREPAGPKTPRATAALASASEAMEGFGPRATKPERKPPRVPRVTSHHLDEGVRMPRFRAGVRLAVTVNAAWLAASTAWLLALLGAAAVRRPSLPAAPPSSLSFVVLVPAHDEEAVIRRTLAALDGLNGPRERRAIVVIADHCDDRTAQIARETGAMVLERSSGERGKGAALTWALDQLAARDAHGDVVVIVDADCVPSPNILDAIGRRVAAGADAVQVDYVVANPHEGTAAALRYAAFRLQNTVRPRGRDALGLSAGLHGTGMGFSRQLLERHPWSATSLVEDQEHHLALQAAGVRVAFAAEATVSSPMPTTLRASSDQQLRWESGHARLLRVWGPTLLAGAVRHRDRLRAAAFVELLVPPQSLLLAGNAMSAAFAHAVGAAPARRLATMALGGQAIYVLAGLTLVRAPLSAFRALAYAPSLVLQKLALVLRLALGRGPSAFVRTARTKVDT